MNVPLVLLRRLSGSAIAVGAALALVGLVVAALAIGQFVAWSDLDALLTESGSDPVGWVVAIGGFALAFALRSFAWSRLLPALSFGQSAAALHLALGANHVLPFRLGEPLRVISALTRTRVPAAETTASGVALRLGDIVGLITIAAALAPSAVLDLLGVAGTVLAVVLTIGLVVGIAAMIRLAGTHLRTPDLVTALLTLSAWFAEALLVWTVASWGGLDVSYLDALLVTVLAVAAQLVAIAPGGVGTYEAAAVSGFVLVGADPADALVVALAAHALKTLYSIVTGVIAMFLPRPSFLSSLRLPRDLPSAEIEPIGSGPVVLFFPAYQEGPRIAEVIERAPKTASGRPLELLVIDDGSTDDTVAKAAAAGATVHSLEKNRGLGRAVAVGFEQAIERFDASVVVFCDADGEYDPAEIEAVIEPILSGQADYVVGSRFAGTIRHMRPHRRFGNQTLTKWVRWMTRHPVTDGQSGYRALSAQAAGATRMAHDYNYAQVLTLDLLLRGFRYAEVPIDYHFRDSGDSFVKLGKYLRAVVPTVIKLISDGPADPSTDQEASVLDDVLVEPN